ncbi:MAG: aspartate 1-decarboxylase [Bacteroidetes bacterium]|nr:aspartate 1-decarboxylase [Bacteroidota bacterium]
MQIQVLKSKIHRAVVTDADINYVGSITIDEALMNASNLIEFEKVQVLNINNGERIETYVIKGKPGSGIICLNGAAARKFLPNDLVIIVSYAMMDFEEAKIFCPSIAFVDSENKLVKGEKTQ